MDFFMDNFIILILYGIRRFAPSQRQYNDNKRFEMVQPQVTEKPDGVGDGPI